MKHLRFVFSPGNLQIPESPTALLDILVMERRGCLSQPPRICLSFAGAEFGILPCGRIFSFGQIVEV